MPKRIAVLDRSKCTRQKCGYRCRKICPPVRMGIDAIVIDKEGWPVISEELCTGCGLCPKICPVDAIKIINLVSEQGTLVFQYGVNTFRLYNLPFPKEGAVVGLLGPNGIGKTTALQLLSGQSKPNMGDYSHEREWGDIIAAFRGHEIQNYFKRLGGGEARVALKPQAIDRIPDVFSGKVEELLRRADERKVFESAVDEFGLRKFLERDISQVSGGELQRIAIAAAWMKDADVYYFDEPTSHLDIKQRMRIARSLRRLAEGEKKSVMVVEHDLAVLDYLSDYAHVFFGVKGAYGVVSHLKAARSGINEYLDGYLRDENTRIRDYSISFAVASEVERKTPVAFSYPAMRKTLGDFSLRCEKGEVKKGEIIGMVGENAIGKTTMVKLLAGIERPDEGEPPGRAKIAYKPQYIKSDYVGTVQQLVLESNLDMEVFEGEVQRKLDMDELMHKEVQHLSGGELQRVAIAITLSQRADIYLFDEPSAFLDVEQRLNFADVLRRLVEGMEKVAFVVDHDVVLIDSVCSRLIVFEGESSVRGLARSPESKRAGMNRFLKEMDLTLRRDRDTGRPRVNKPGSRMDREQREAGEYYYYEAN